MYICISKILNFDYIARKGHSQFYAVAFYLFFTYINPYVQCGKNAHIYEKKNQY